MTIEAITTPWPCGSLRLQEVCHTDVKIAYAVLYMVVEYLFY